MKGFLVKILLFFIPFLTLVPVELKLRNNSFRQKSIYLEQERENIQCLIFGSSQIWRAINPEWFLPNSASLALPASAIDIDVLLFKNYVEKLPNLTTVIFEVSYHSLEERRGNQWGKNHLLLNHFEVNNYAGGKVPWQDHFLITSQPVFYLKKLFLMNNKIDDGKFNQYGFIEAEPDTNYASSSNFFKRLHYQKNKIETQSTIVKEELHAKESIENFETSIKELNEVIQICDKKGIKVALVSPPKYELYNKAMNPQKLERRNHYLLSYSKNKAVNCLVYDTLFQNKPEYFLNENHLNVSGAKQFSNRLEKDINQFIVR